MTWTDAPEAAKNVRTCLEGDIRQGLRLLVDFARDFAIDQKLRNRAVLLAASLDMPPMIEQRDEVFAESLMLLGSILRDIENADETVLASKEQRDSHLRELAERDLERGVVVRAHQLGYRFPKGGFHLSGVDLELRRGEITGVVGENANGKTTLFRILVGELRHGEGTLTYPDLGSDAPGGIDWVCVKRSIAYVPQTPKRWFGPLEDNLRYAAAIKGITGRANDREFNYIVERLGLREYLDREWDELSGGFKLRFALASALIWRPRLLALDEPLAHLDFRSQLVVLRDIRDLAKSYRDPIAVILSSQHLHEIEAVADRIMFLDQGNVVYNGSLSAIGAERESNVYEVGCDLTAGQLRSQLRHPDIVDVAFDGLSLSIHTKTQMEPKAFLRLLDERDVSIRYFRDISRSVKQLFIKAPTQ